jgi:hypothetical protein
LQKSTARTSPKTKASSEDSEIDVGVQLALYEANDRRALVARALARKVWRFSRTTSCQAGTPVDPDDGVACTDDSCDEVGDVVVNAASDLNCDDADACTADSCDALLGCAHDPIELCVGVGVPANFRVGPGPAHSALLYRRGGNPPLASFDVPATAG